MKKVYLVIDSDHPHNLCHTQIKGVYGEFWLAFESIKKTVGEHVVLYDYEEGHPETVIAHSNQKDHKRTFFIQEQDLQVWPEWF